MSGCTAHSVKVWSLVLGFLAGITVFSVSALAAPLSGEPVKLSQPDGTTFVAIPGGDEWFNWVSHDGFLIAQDSAGWWRYATLQRGAPEPGAALAGADKAPSGTATLADIPAWAATVERPAEAFAQRRSAKSRATTEPVLVVLVGFQDWPLNTTDAYWQNLFFGATGQTVYAYYNEVSGGNLQLVPASETSGTVNDGVVRVLLPPSAQYGGNHANPAGTIDNRNRWIVFDALTAADAWVDFSLFDVRPPTGFITPDELHIVIVAAGYEYGYDGAATPSPAVTSHWWSLGFPYPWPGGVTVPAVTADGVNLADWYGSGSGYIQTGELHTNHPATAGVICHELGHDMGLPDLYDWTYASHGIGAHGLMGWGPWGATATDAYRGQTPTHMCAWSKAQMGWVTPTVACGNADYSLSAAGTTGYNVIRVNTRNPLEYFLIENRQLVGFDAGLYRWFSVSSGGAGGGGLAVWHVDENMTDNNDWTHKMVDLEEANTATLGYGELDYYSGGSPPPAQGNRHHYFYSGHAADFGHATSPNTAQYDSRTTYANASSISPSGPVMKCYIATQHGGSRVREWSTYLGGSGDDGISDIAIDGQDNVYVVGGTGSYDFPTTPGVYDRVNSGAGMFLTKFSPAGVLMYSTFFHDTTSLDVPGAYGLAVDGSGCAYLAGITHGGLPVTAGAYDTTFGGNNEPDGFVTKFDASASSLVYSTYLGASFVDTSYGIAVDSSANAIVVGTCGPGFPATHGTHGGGRDIFVTKLNSSGSGLVYSRVFGSWYGIAEDVAVDTAGNAYVCGQVEYGLPVTTGAFDQTSNGGGNDGFMAKVGPNGSLDYCTYLGGTGSDSALALAVDAQGFAYLTGTTTSSNLPTTSGVLGPSLTTFIDAFVTKLHPSAYSGLAYSTYYDAGLSWEDRGEAACVDTSGNVYLALNAYTFVPEYTDDSLACELNAGATALLYSTQIGGTGEDGPASGIALDSEGALYLAGYTTTASFTPPMNGYDTTLDGAYDGFIVKLGWEQVTKSIVLACPDGGEQWARHRTVSIQWSSSGAGSTVDIELSRDGYGGAWELLFDDTPNDGAESWVVSGSSSANCVIRITDNSGQPLTDLSNAVFAVVDNADLDGDQDMDQDDAVILTAVLLGTDTDPNHAALADINDDGNVDGLDVQAFIDAIL